MAKELCAHADRTRCAIDRGARAWCCDAAKTTKYTYSTAYTYINNTPSVQPAACSGVFVRVFFRWKKTPSLPWKTRVKRAAYAIATAGRSYALHLVVTVLRRSRRRRRKKKVSRSALHRVRARGYRIIVAFMDPWDRRRCGKSFDRPKVYAIRTHTTMNRARSPAPHRDRDGKGGSSSACGGLAAVGPRSNVVVSHAGSDCGPATDTAE